MARYEEKFKTYAEAKAFVDGVENDESALKSTIKKIDLRSYQGGYKVIVKTTAKETPNE